MKEIKKNEAVEGDKEIILSKTVKAGKRIYYLDVKKNRRGDMFLVITESKKVVSDDASQVNFEKHKIFLYKEDLIKFENGLRQMIQFIEHPQPVMSKRMTDNREMCNYKQRTHAETATVKDKEFKIDIEF